MDLFVSKSRVQCDRIDCDENEDEVMKRVRSRAGKFVRRRCDEYREYACRSRKRGKANNQLRKLRLPRHASNHQ